MPRVRFLREKIVVEVPEGETILGAAKRAGAPEGDRCGGVCACSTCHVYVTKGFDKLSEIADEEFDILDKAFDVRATSRLGCQAKIEGADTEIEVEISGESFQAFLDEHPDEKERAQSLRKG
jgi:2Fe-2S ferredoxin